LADRSWLAAENAMLVEDEQTFSEAWPNERNEHQYQASCFGT
jgi:hypothetical protein